MRVNNVITKINQNEKSFGINLVFPSTTIVELTGQAGFDFITFDSEHGPFTIDILLSLIHI